MKGPSLSETVSANEWPGFVSRLERFERVGSTQAVVRGWLDEGEDEVCVAVADEQTEGRGRLDRRWEAPAGRSLNTLSSDEAFLPLSERARLARVLLEVGFTSPCPFDSN